MELTDTYIFHLILVLAFYEVYQFNKFPQTVSSKSVQSLSVFYTWWYYNKHILTNVKEIAIRTHTQKTWTRLPACHNS